MNNMATPKALSQNAKLGIVIVIAVAIIAVLAYTLVPRAVATSPEALQAFAQCLAEKKATMYGAAWCPHCQAQKKLFGDAFHAIPYVECPDHPDVCTAKGVTGYPTWILADGTKLEGEQQFESLASKTGCACWRWV